VLLRGAALKVDDAAKIPNTEKKTDKFFMAFSRLTLRQNY
jgi:hypothetical protein